MDEKVAIGLASGLFGAVTTYVFAVLKLRKELEYKYDTDLRAQRIPKYQELWKALESLAKYARPKELTNADLEALTGALRKWYFESGGLFLSETSREAYFALQDGIRDELESGGRSTAVPVEDGKFEVLRSLGSNLRTALTRDVGTRKEPRIN